jgi:hypothetical protein
MIFNRWSAVAALCCISMLEVGCGTSVDVVPPLWLGMPGDRLPASTASNVFWVEADVDGQPGAQVIVDTGAPIALLHVEAFGGTVPVGSAIVGTMTLGGTTLWKVPTVGDHEPHKDTLTATGQRDGGIVGFTVFGQFEMSFNYRDNQVVIGAAPPPDGVLPPTVVPFSLEGGGAGPITEGGEVIRFPASRVILPATVEGREVTMLLDTGASWVGLRSPLYNAIVQDGRAQLSVEATLAQGTATTNVARVRSVSVAGAEVKDPVAASAQTVDELLNHLSAEVGHTIDGLLGAPYLREFYVTVDYPNRTLRLYRYTDESHVLDDYRKVGVEIAGILSRGGNSFVVQKVYPGTDAEKKGIQRLDNILAIDGELLFALDVAAVDRKLRGPVGASRRLDLAGPRTVDVLIDDLLPLP